MYVVPFSSSTADGLIAELHSHSCGIVEGSISASKRCPRRALPAPNKDIELVISDLHQGYYLSRHWPKAIVFLSESATTLAQR
jgi:hypothetical protein